MQSANTKSGRRLGAAALLVLGGVSAARAQEAAAPSGTLEEIIVTARKVSENLQDTPIAISVFSGPALENRQVFPRTS